MPDTAIQAVLEDVAAEVLEKMFFLSTAPIAPFPVGPGAIIVRLAFEGDPPGRLYLHMSGQAALSIAANFLGEDPSAIEPRQISEVCGELANMICGAILSRVESTATFHLRSPEVLRTEPPIRPDSQFVYLDTGEGPLSIIVETETPICPATEESAY